MAQEQYSQNIPFGIALVFALVIALLNAQNFADSYNDGNRLAIVESVVDYHTLAIDHSIFVNPPDITPHPYERAPDHLRKSGTLDKMYVNGHFYSDKPYTPMLLLSGWYKILQVTTGLTAAERADLFCYWMTVASSGIAYVIAVCSALWMCRIVGLSALWQALLTLGFALGTMALPYCQHLNSHILLLGAAAPLTALVAKQKGNRPGAKAIVAMGLLAGAGYSIEQGIGQLLWGWTLLYVAYRTVSFRMALLYVVASLPFLLSHHIVNYVISGTWKPPGTIPEYFDYPGSIFDKSNLTGQWIERDVIAIVQYGGNILFGVKGFLRHNPLLWLALPGLIVLWWKRWLPTAEGAWIAAWWVSTWLTYTLLSNNFSGHCLSIRWFLPLLAPAFYVLALLLKNYPQIRGDFLILLLGSLVLGIGMAKVGLWREAPWTSTPVQASTLGIWGLYRAWLLWRKFSERIS